MDSSAKIPGSLGILFPSSEGIEFNSNHVDPVSVDFFNKEIAKPLQSTKASELEDMLQRYRADPTNSANGLELQLWMGRNAVDLLVASKLVGSITNAAQTLMNNQI